MPNDIIADVGVSELTFEQAFERLESIVQRMNDASAPLEELISLYEQGAELGRHCEKLLAGYEARMEMVSKNTLVSEAAKLDREEACEDGEEET